MNKKENKLLIFTKCSPKSGTFKNSLEILSHLFFWKLQWGRYDITSSLFICAYNIHILNYKCFFLPHFPFHHFTVLYIETGLGLSSRDSSLSYKLHIGNILTHSCVPDQPRSPYYLNTKHHNYCKDVLILSSLSLMPLPTDSTGQSRGRGNTGGSDWLGLSKYPGLCDTISCPMHPVMQAPASWFDPTVQRVTMFFFQAGPINLSQPVHLGARLCSVIWKKVGYTRTEDRDAVRTCLREDILKSHGKCKSLYLIIDVRDLKSDSKIIPLFGVEPSCEIWCSHSTLITSRKAEAVRS